jgi:hypothetical protein
VRRRAARRAGLALAGVPAHAQDVPGGGPCGAPVALSLEEAVARASARARGTRIAEARVDERRALARAARTDVLPRLEVNGQWLGNTGAQSIAIPQGALGRDAAGRPLPSTTGARAAVAVGLVRLRHRRAADHPAAPHPRPGRGPRARRPSRPRRRATASGGTSGSASSGSTWRRSSPTGAPRPPARRSRRARPATATRCAPCARASRGRRRRRVACGRARARQALVAHENAAADARAELAVLVGLDPDAPLVLEEPAPLPRLTPPVRDERQVGSPLRRTAEGPGTVRRGGPRAAERGAAGRRPRRGRHDGARRVARAVARAVARGRPRRQPEVRAARAQRAAADAGVAAARAAWVPDVALYGQFVRQSLTPILGRELWTGGVRVAWTAWDYGRRSHETRRRSRVGAPPTSSWRGSPRSST